MEEGERGLDYSGTMRSTTAARAWLCLAASARACTDFYMNFTDHKLSVRTMDLGTTANASLVITPRGRAFASRAPAAAAGGDATVGAVLEWTSAYGHVSFNFADHVLSAAPSAWERALADALVADGLNEAGLSCSTLALTDARFEDWRDAADARPRLNAIDLPKWAVERFARVGELKAALASVLVWSETGGVHFACRDATGASVVLEWVGGVARAYDDLNDGGATGWGVMTNEPPFGRSSRARAFARRAPRLSLSLSAAPRSRVARARRLSSARSSPCPRARADWQLRNVEHALWKSALARPALAVPGGFYPDERFLRAHMIKAGLDDPRAYAPPAGLEEAVARCVSVLNAVTVPPGLQRATDTGAGSGEGGAGEGDHTLWGVVRDHRNRAVYWRSARNPSLRRVRLADFDLSAGAAVRALAVEAGPFFADMAAAFA